MKKRVSFILALVGILALTTGCNTTSSEGAEGNVFETTVMGYGGELTLNLQVEDGKLVDIEVVSSNETAPVFDRAFPIIEERIVDAQTTEVDNVSGATISSYAVKSAVNKVMKEQGVDFGSLSEPVRDEFVALENLETDIVIVGGGPAGLAAAISAKEAGAENVTIIEKLDILSGNGKFDMNFFGMYRSEAKELEGTNEMTAEEFAVSKDSTVDAGARAEVWAEIGYDLDAWLRGMGIELNYTYGSDSHMAETNEYAGDHIQHGLEERAYELGVNILTGTEGVDIIMEDGSAVGVKVENRDGYYDIYAGAVIVATGGFSANPELIAEYVPGAEIVETSNQMGATGDFVEIFKNHDIKLESMDTLSIFKLILNPRRDLTGAGDGFMLVNNLGERFADESSSGLPLAYTMLEQPDGEVYYIYDQRLYESFYRLEKHNDLGYHIKADTLEELAEQISVPAEALAETLEAYNKAVNGEQADPFRETPFTTPFDTEGPFYAAKVESAIHMTKGGVAANENAEVINNSDQVVPGLYAAGEVTNTSGAYSAAVIFGKVSGMNAAEYIK